MADNVTYRPAAFPTLDGADERYFTNEFRKISDALKSLTGPWTAYTPTVAPTTGAFTTVSAVGRYKQMGKTLFVQIVITITTNGTAAGLITASLPKAAVQGMLAQGANTTAGYGLIAAGGANSSTVQIAKYDGTYPGANGTGLALSGFYEVA